MAQVPQLVPQPVVGMSQATRSLFGGAMQCCIPSRFIDVSQFRQIPDNQEVFADPDTDQSVVIEILEMQRVSNEKAAKFFLDDLSSCNEAVSTVVSKAQLLDAKQLCSLRGAPFFASYLTAVQKIAKFRDTTDAANTVEVLLVNIRLPSVTSDLLITFNVPSRIHPKSSSASATAGSLSKTVLMEFLKSFKINNWGLFKTS